MPTFRTLALIGLLWLGVVGIAGRAGETNRQLTYEQALQIVASHPQFKKARNGGLCPGIDRYAHDPNGTLVSFGIVGLCGSDTMPGFGHDFLSVTIDLQTGRLSDFFTDAPLSFPGLRQYVEGLFSAPEAAPLSAEAAKCLAAQSPLVSADAGLPCLHVFPERSDEPSRGWNFAIVSDCASPPGGTAGHAVGRVNVDSATGTITDMLNGGVIDSPRLAQMRGWLRLEREAPGLSASDMEALVSLLPSAKQQLAAGSVPRVVFLADFSGPSEYLFRITDGSEKEIAVLYEEQKLYSVDRTTGVVRDPKTRREYRSPESESFSRQRLAESEKRIEEARSSLKDACAGGR
jgi:hypothetical protein